MAGYFELLKNDAGAFRFNLKAGNHEVILSSESYTSAAAAQGGIVRGQRRSRPRIPTRRWKWR